MDYRKHIPFEFTDRPGWQCLGWIKNPPLPEINMTFHELCSRAATPDHGEERAVDVYEQGAVCWYRA